MKGGSATANNLQEVAISARAPTTQGRRRPIGGRMTASVILTNTLLSQTTARVALLGRGWITSASNMQDVTIGLGAHPMQDRTCRNGRGRMTARVTLRGPTTARVVGHGGGTQLTHTRLHAVRRIGVFNRQAARRRRYGAAHVWGRLHGRRGMMWGLFVRPGVACVWL